MRETLPAPAREIESLGPPGCGIAENKQGLAVAGAAGRALHRALECLVAAGHRQAAQVVGDLTVEAMLETVVKPVGRHLIIGSCPRRGGQGIHSLIPSGRAIG